MLDGVTMLPDTPKPPVHERIGKWVGQLDKLHDRAPRRYSTLEDAAAQMVLHNKRLSRELALHLATHGARQNEDGTYSWKFDPYQRASAPHRLWPDDHIALWSRITCPTLLLNAGESFLAGARAAGWSATFRRRASRPLQGPDTGCSMTSRRRCWVRSGGFGLARTLRASSATSASLQI